MIMEVTLEQAEKLQACDCCGKPYIPDENHKYLCDNCERALPRPNGGWAFPKNYGNS